MAAALVFCRRKFFKRHQSATVTSHESGKWKSSVAAALLITSPALSSVVADRHLNANAATMALALTPVVVAVAAAAYSVGTELAGLLWPGLVGVAGLLLLLPEPNLSFWRTDVALATMPLLAGSTAVLLIYGHIALGKCDMDAGDRHNRWIERGLLLAAILFGLLWLQELRLHEDIRLSWIGSAADGLVSLLSLWTLERVGAVRWSAQFLFTPLMTIIEGVVLLRPALTTRSWVGFFLLLVGTGSLLMPRHES